MDIGERKRYLSRLIMGYLESNPDAADTPRGITQWWMKHGRIEARVAEVTEILEDLRQKGMVASRDLGDGNTLFKLRRQAGPSEHPGPSDLRAGRRHSGGVQDHLAGQDSGHSPETDAIF